MRFIAFLLLLCAATFAQNDSSTTTSDSLVQATADTLADTLAVRDSGAVDSTAAVAEAQTPDSAVQDATVDSAATVAAVTDTTTAVAGRENAVGEVNPDNMQRPAMEPFSLPSARKSPSLLQQVQRPVKAVLRELGFTRFFRAYGMRTLVLLLSFGLIIAAAYVLMQKADRRRFMTTTRLSIMDKEVQKACRHIERNFADTELSLDSICEALVTGPAFLESLFERELGMSVMGFLAQVRTNRIKLALEKDPTSPIDELVVATGFRDPVELQETFRTTTGLSLEDYRKSLAVEQSHAS